MQRNLWHPLPQHPELSIGQYVVPNFASNCIALRRDEHTTVVSPGAPLLAPWLALHPDTTAPLDLLMPNAYHYLGVATWQAAFTQVRLFASAKAIPRLTGKGLHGIRPVETALPALPEGYDLLIPPGHRGGDVWLRKRFEGGCLWITCDSFQAYERYSNQPIARALQKLLGTAPGLKMSQVVKWLLLDDRPAFKRWLLERAREDRPTLLIPSHGEILQDAALAEQLIELVERRL